MCFIPADLNKSIQDDKPSKYFKKFKKGLSERKFKSILNSHLIPQDESSGIWDNNVSKGYNKFIEARAKILKKEFEKLLN